MSILVLTIFAPIFFMLSYSIFSYSLEPTYYVLTLNYEDGKPMIPEALNFIFIFEFDKRVVEYGNLIEAITETAVRTCNSSQIENVVNFNATFSNQSNSQFLCKEFRYGYEELKGKFDNYSNTLIDCIAQHQSGLSTSCSDNYALDDSKSFVHTFSDKFDQKTLETKKSLLTVDISHPTVIIDFEIVPIIVSIDKGLLFSSFEEQLIFTILAHKSELSNMLFIKTVNLNKNKYLHKKIFVFKKLDYIILELVSIFHLLTEVAKILTSRYEDYLFNKYMAQVLISKVYRNEKIQKYIGVDANLNGLKKQIESITFFNYLKSYFKPCFAGEIRTEVSTLMSIENIKVQESSETIKFINIIN